MTDTPQLLGKTFLDGSYIEETNTSDKIYCKLVHRGLACK